MIRPFAAKWSVTHRMLSFLDMSRCSTIRLREKEFIVCTFLMDTLVLSSRWELG